MAKKNNSVNKNLDVKDRLILMNILPKTGGLVEQITQRQLIRKVEFTSEEVSNFELRDTRTGVTFNREKSQEIEIEFTGEEMELIDKGIDELDHKKEVSQEHINTILKFRDI